MNDDVLSFVAYLFTDGRGKKRYTLDAAQYDIDQWTEDGIELPEGLTAEVLMREFNRILQEDVA